MLQNMMLSTGRHAYTRGGSGQTSFLSILLETGLRHAA